MFLRRHKPWTLKLQKDHSKASRFYPRARDRVFAGWEPLRQYTQSSGFARVATEAERQGDFSQSVYNTATNQKIFLFRQFEFNADGTALSNQRIVLPANTAYPQWQ